MVGEIDARTASRHAIEALRAGVPNGFAVRALGCTQTAIEQAFLGQLAPAAAPGSRGGASGLLVTGDFGTGKSHLFEYFQELALDRRFVCSKVVVSKETPLFDPAKLFRAAVEAARVPGRIGDGMTEIAMSLKTHGAAFDELLHVVEDPTVGLASHFAATLHVFRQGKSTPETTDRIIRFWGGETLGITEIRRYLREIGAGKLFTIDPVAAAELARQRLLFAPLLIRAAGFAGWVLLVDEVELIGRYSLLQRARSYAEVARLLGRLEGGGIPGLITMLAMTADFAGEVIDRRRDEEKVPARLRARNKPGDELTASEAERGMAVIQREAKLLAQPDQRAVEATYAKVKQLYTEAHGWPAPEVPLGEREMTSRMRQFVKRWITEWDLRRLYPEDAVDIETEELPPDYTEQPEIETPSEESTEAEP